MTSRLRSQPPIGLDKIFTGSRRHVLIVAYFYPPAIGGGVPRPVKIGKYLQQQGWRVTVLTLDRPGEADPRMSAEQVRVARVRELRLGTVLYALGACARFVRRVWEVTHGGWRDAKRTLLKRGFARDEAEIESSHIGWAIPAIWAGVRLHRRHPVDVIVVSSPPASAGAVGWALRRLCGVPYVVEYRDPWTVGAFWTTDADGNPRADPVTRLRHTVARRMESVLLSWSAGAVIVNGQQHVGRLRAAFPTETAGKSVAHIPNGVDLEDIPRRGPDRLPGPLRILHVGFFYHFHSPHHFVEGLARLHDSCPAKLRGVAFEFIGDGFPEELLLAARDRGLGQILSVSSPCRYSQALRAMSEADGLLLVLPPLESYSDCIPTKLYEYIATGNPILAIVDAGGASASLLRSFPHSIVAGNRDCELITKGISSFIELLRRPPVDRPRVPANAVTAHHYRSRAIEMNALLHDVTEARPPRPQGRGSSGQHCQVR